MMYGGMALDGKDHNITIEPQNSSNQNCAATSTISRHHQPCVTNKANYVAV